MESWSVSQRRRRGEMSSWVPEFAAKRRMVGCCFFCKISVKIDICVPCMLVCASLCVFVSTTTSSGLSSTQAVFDM